MQHRYRQGPSAWGTFTLLMPKDDRGPQQQADRTVLTGLINPPSDVLCSHSVHPVLSALVSFLLVYILVTSVVRKKLLMEVCVNNTQTNTEKSFRRYKQYFLGVLSNT